MKLGPPVDHLGVAIPFVRVDEVVPRALHLAYVDVWSQPEDVVVPQQLDAHDEVGEAERVLGSPWGGERLA